MSFLSLRVRRDCEQDERRIAIDTDSRARSAFLLPSLHPDVQPSRPGPSSNPDILPTADASEQNERVEPFLLSLSCFSSSSSSSLSSQASLDPQPSVLTLNHSSHLPDTSRTDDPRTLDPTVVNPTNKKRSALPLSPSLPLCHAFVRPTPPDASPKPKQKKKGKCTHPQQPRQLPHKLVPIQDLLLPSSSRLLHLPNDLLLQLLLDDLLGFSGGLDGSVGFGSSGRFPSRCCCC